jgi:hypothetical protein
VKPIRGNFLVVYAFPVILLFVTVLFPGRGWAQQEQQNQQVLSGEFSLSQEVHWENSVLPMGDYVYYADSSHWPAVVRVQGKDGDFSGTFIPAILLRPGESGKTRLMLSKFGKDIYITGLYLHGAAGEFSFSIPPLATENNPENQSSGRAHLQEGSARLSRAAEYLTIINPNRDKVSAEEIERVYLSACEAVEKEYNRHAPLRPRLILRLGTDNNTLRFPMREIQLKKWDERRFADAVIDVALHDMVSQEDRVRLSNTAVSAAEATVNVCELKACVN